MTWGGLRFASRGSLMGRRFLFPGCTLGFLEARLALCAGTAVIELGAAYT